MRFRISFLACLVLALCGWIFYDDPYRISNLKHEELSDAEQRYVGTANTLGLSLQFFLFGEKRAPKDWDEFRNSVYFISQPSELKNPYGGWPEFWAGQVPEHPAAGSFGLINTIPEVAKIIVTLDRKNSSGKPFQLSSPHTQSGQMGSLPRQDSVSTWTYLGDDVFIRDVKALARDDQRLFWTCQFLNKASDVVSLKGGPGGNEPPHRSLSELRQNYSWLFNWNVLNPYWAGALIERDGEPSFLKPSAGEIYRILVTRQVPSQSTSASSTHPVQYPVYLCYGRSGALVNRRLYETLKLKKLVSGR